MDPQAMLASQLHDIHLPPPISWWPPASGWWMLGLLMLALAGIIIYYFITKLTRKREQARLLKHLGKLSQQHKNSPQQLLQAVSALLRSLAIFYYGGERLPGITGEPWLKFLALAANCDDFIGNTGKILLVQPYCKTFKEDIIKFLPPLLALTRLWIKQLPPTSKQLATFNEVFSC